MQVDKNKLRKAHIACKARNNPETQESVNLLTDLQVIAHTPKLCLKCSKKLSEGDPLFCRECYDTSEIKDMLKVKDKIKKQRIEKVLKQRKELQEKIGDFSGKTYLEIASLRNISLSESIKLTNSLLNAGYLIPSPEGVKREGFIVFEFPVFDDFIFCT